MAHKEVTQNNSNKLPSHNIQKKKDFVLLKMKISIV